MKLDYLVIIDAPHTHLVQVRIKAKKQGQKMVFFMPSWSPGSYLMREYARHVVTFRAEQDNGEVLFSQKIEKGKWEIDWEKSDLKKINENFEVVYEVYCGELTVRTSMVDDSHAFLHGPSYLMGLEGELVEKPTIEFRFPPLWSKISTPLEEIGARNEFIYQALDYDDLVDSPVEIGCHDTDGFMSHGKEHHLSFYGKLFPHKHDLKQDIKKIIDHIAGFMGGMPYEHYHIIAHFLPNIYGGLEHLDSTVVQFDGRRMGDRKAYLKWLSLISHEYFHTWNVKRIRPVELGPFNYTEENYTTMLWLAEGLTSFVDELFVYHCGLCSLEEYLDIQRNNIDRYLKVPGRKFHSLEQSSFNAWIKLYRPDENIRNTSVSYYLKGGHVFFALQVLLAQKGKSLKDLIHKLWNLYLERPEKGVNTEEVLQMIEDIGGKDIADKFWTMVRTTEDIGLEDFWKKAGVKWVWSQDKKPWLGLSVKEENERPVIEEVILDGPGYKAGLNAGDRLVSVNNMKMTYDEFHGMNDFFLIDQKYTLQILRQGMYRDIDVIFENEPPRVLKLIVEDEKLLKAALSL